MKNSLHALLIELKNNFYKWKKKDIEINKDKEKKKFFKSKDIFQLLKNAFDRNENESHTENPLAY